MFEAIKYGARTLVVTAVVAAILVLIVFVKIPVPDYTVFSQMIGKGYAVMSHWVPAFPAIYTFIITVLGLWISIKVFKFGMAGVAFLLKVMY